MFLVRGLVFSHEAVRAWEAKLTSALAEDLRRRRRGKAGRSWYVDETYLKVQGRWCYLYRAIDRSGALVDVLFSEHRDMAWTYILRCRDGTFYVGSTIDLARRVSEHDLGFGAKYTRPRRRRPVALVWSAELDRIADAFWLEKQIQGWGREKRMALIEGRLGDLRDLARNRQLDPE